MTVFFRRMSPEPPNPKLTLLLQSAAAGDQHASAQLLPLVYDELRRLAAARLARTPPGNTLQPTALVHEAYLRLTSDNTDPHWQGRRHFFGAAAQAMRDILVEQTRRKRSLKRGGDRARTDLSHAEPAFEEPVEDLLALHEALRRLEALDPRKAEIVMLRYFAGLTQSETADLLNLSERTIEREWRFIKAWLRAAMTGDATEPSP
ncbi:MAG: ECF-type sigma factor [Phycisphaerales bacterium]